MNRLIHALLTLGLVLSCCLVPHQALAEGNPLETASQEDKAAASKAFMEGKEAFDAQRFEEALEKFKTSYQVVRSPNSLLMVVQCLTGLGRNAEAYTVARRVAAEGDAAAAIDDKYKRTADAAREEMAAIAPKIGLINLKIGQVEAGAVLAVNGRTVDRPEWSQPIPVEPGPATVVLTSSAGLQEEKVNATAGGSYSVPIGVQPDKPKPEAGSSDSSGGFDPFDGGEDQRMVAYIAGGVGVAGLITAAIFGGMHLSNYGDLEDQCSDGVCSPDLESDADSGRTYQTVGNVMLVVGLVGVAAGAALFFTTDFTTVFESSDERGDTTAKLSVGPGSLLLHGSF